MKQNAFEKFKDHLKQTPEAKAALKKELVSLQKASEGFIIEIQELEANKAPVEVVKAKKTELDLEIAKYNSIKESLENFDSKNESIINELALSAQQEALACMENQNADIDKLLNKASKIKDEYFLIIQGLAEILREAMNIAENHAEIKKHLSPGDQKARPVFKNPDFKALEINREALRQKALDSSMPIAWALME